MHPYKQWNKSDLNPKGKYTNSDELFSVTEVHLITLVETLSSQSCKLENKEAVQK